MRIEQESSNSSSRSSHLSPFPGSSEPNNETRPTSTTPSGSALSSNPLYKNNLPGHFYGSTSTDQFLSARSQSISESITNSVISVSKKTWDKIKEKRFLSVAIFSFIVIIIFNLIFLPRTSLDRDLRRIHGEYLTFTDCSHLFLSHLHTTNQVKRWLQFQNSNPHSPGDNPKELVNLFNELGLKASTEKYEIWMPDTKAKDPDHGFIRCPYSPSTKISARYIYGNYGTKHDFTSLINKGIDIVGKIVIMRSGMLSESIKVMNAQTFGAAGVIFYSDPGDDGKFSSLHYPQFPLGYSRNDTSIVPYTLNQIVLQPGDPTTPGWSSTLFSHRVDPETVPQIPAVCASSSTIRPLLKKLNNGTDLGWHGDFIEFDYSASISDVPFTLISRAEYSIRPIYNVIVEIKGIMKDEQIIIGASRDTINGVGGSSNGFATLMELASGLAQLVKRKWKPLRTIKLVSWDGSSYGSLGSTEFGEFYSQRLAKSVMLYIDLAGVHGSSIFLESSPLYKSILTNTMKSIITHNSGDNQRSLWNYFQDNATNSSIVMISQKSADYSVFQCHLGVPSLSIGFSRNSDRDPVGYENSEYDSYQWMSVLDPTFHYANWEAQLTGLLVLELSEKEVIDAKTYEYGSIIANKFREITDQVPRSWFTRRVMVGRNKNSYDNPTVEEELGAINSLLNDLLANCIKFDDWMKELRKRILQDIPWFRLYQKIKTAIQIKVANSKVRSLDRLFIAGGEYTDSPFEKKNDGILRGRKWFRHLLFAPDRNTGLQLILLPGLVEALENQDAEYFTINLAALHNSLKRMNDMIK